LTEEQQQTTTPEPAAQDAPAEAPEAAATADPAVAVVEEGAAVEAVAEPADEAIVADAEAVDVADIPAEPVEATPEAVDEAPAEAVDVADIPAEPVEAAPEAVDEAPAEAVDVADIPAEPVEAPAEPEPVIDAEVLAAEIAEAPAAEPEPEPEPAPPAGPEPSTMAELLAEQDADIRSFKHGDVVEGTVVRIDRAFSGLNQLQGKAGQTLAGNDWLMSIRSRISIPGGTCEFDLPSYYAWQQHDAERRRIDLRAWTATLTPLADALTADGPGAFVVLAGSLPPGAPGDAYARLGRIASAAGATWAVDVDEPALSDALAAGPWLVKVNAHEAERATRVPTATADAAAVAGTALRGLGATHAIVTRGVDGAVLVSADGAWQAGPPSEHGRFSVGSGDAFLAGLVVALADGVALPDAIRTAAACGAANALIPGQGELRPADVARLLPLSEITRLR